MAAIYLWTNAVLYALLALWCTLMPARTSQAVGFIELSNSGQSEFAVIYGGMQFGFAFLFGWAALSGNYRFGLIFALSIYIPILLFRIVSVARFWPVSSTTLATGALEVVLTAAAILLWFNSEASIERMIQDSGFLQNLAAPLESAGIRSDAVQQLD